MQWVYLACAIVVEVIATTALKASDGFRRPLATIVVIVGYLIAFYMLSQTLKVMPVAVVYAIWSALGVALVTVVAWVVYGERLEPPTLLGLALIILGVLILKLFSKSPLH
ncbi:MAG: multidrug efflux SMR transporter [Deinococcales bacterium]